METRAITVYCDDVKPYLGGGRYDLRVLLSDAPQLSALTRVYGPEGGTERGGIPPLDLDHDERRAVQAKRVDLASRQTHVPLQHPVAGFR